MSCSCYAIFIKTPLLTGNIGAYFVVTTGEYLRDNHKFRVWDSWKSNFLNVPFDRARWDKYMFNNMTVGRYVPPRSVERKKNCPMYTCAVEKYLHHVAWQYLLTQANRRMVLGCLTSTLVLTRSSCPLRTCMVSNMESCRNWTSTRIQTTSRFF